MALPHALLALLFFVAQQDYISDGLKALDANQPSVAEGLFRHAIQSDPRDFSAHFNLALALSIEQKDDEAITELRRTLELKPALYEADINLGTLLLRNNRAAEAVPVLREALDTAQQPARTTLLYAQALDAAHDAAQSSEQYRKALELDPNAAPAHAGLARIALAQGNPSDAADHFHKAAALDARYRPGLLDVAALYVQKKDLSSAIAIYKEFPENAAAKERLAQLLVETGNNAAAIPALEAAVQQSPSVANRLALADAYNLNKQFDNAIKQLQLAAATEPSNYDVRMDLGRELRDQRHFVPAADQFAAAAKLRPDSVKAWNELAAVLVVNEEYANGLAALDRVRALRSEVPGDFFYRAICLEKLRQPKPALEAYRQFLNSDSGKMPDQEFQARQEFESSKVS